MKPDNFSTKEEITWCPGCTNYSILGASEKALAELVKERKIKAKDIAIVTGIGCHAKIYDYLNVNGFYSIHGRVLPTCLGIKTGNPQLTVIGYGGDGDTYAEGISHFIHTCRYNANLTMLVHDNQVFALTTGQVTPTSEKGFKGPSTPLGENIKPLNPVLLALVSGATFIARGYALDVPYLKDIIKRAILHKGFSLIDILQPCIAFHNAIPYFQKHIYKLKNYNDSNFGEAIKKAKEWDYNFDKNSKIPIGVFYNVQKQTFGEGFLQLKNPWYRVKRNLDSKKILEEFK